MKQSFIMGAMVGAGFGSCIGLYQAITYRSWIMFPLITITSSGSFGFFLMFGSLVRMDASEREHTPQLNYLRAKIDTKEIEDDVAFWRHKYMGRNF
mmetsp:Transcript_32534/g.29383  ORF Transcript_32534/g.29383 Transcript_32534/m.29383 type:complete len:96 (-) Transcript_32534:45-332(-)